MSGAGSTQETQSNLEKEKRVVVCELEFRQIKESKTNNSKAEQNRENNELLEAILGQREIR